ncbi:MAG: serine hydrolase [Betaproteobacteria bacterium]|nr:serine hydrolase [Betaproteobacteria bacterium]
MSLPLCVTSIKHPANPNGAMPQPRPDAQTLRGQPTSTHSLIALVLSLSLCVSTASPAVAQSGPAAPPESSGELSPSFSQPALAGFDAFVEAELKKWNTPGAAIVVVKDGRVILQRGYGLRDVERKLPMTAQTVQPIASITKSFTVSALATLVRDGKLSWDKPVRDYLPDFKLHNDYSTLQVTPRDMLTHRTGLPRHDLSWVGTKATREELYKRLQHMEQSAALRTLWQYNNFMYMTAGYLGGKVAGSSWEELVQKNLFDPLGMKSAGFTVSQMEAATDHAVGYAHDDKERPNPVPRISAEAMGPTGSINSNATDMGNYLRMLMNKGQLDGRTLINAPDLIEMTNPQMVMADNRRFAEISSTQYGMGFFLTHYRGYRLVHHGGNLAGLSALLSFMPQDNVGVFVAVNLSSSPLPSVFSYAVYDRLLGLKPVDWSGRQWDIKEKGKASEESAKKQNLTPRKIGTKPSHALDEYVGEYSHPAYDKIVVTRKGDDLVGAYNGLTSPFKHFHHDVFEAPENKLSYLSKTKLAFQTDIEGEISSLKVAFEPAIKPLEFVRQPDASFKDPAFLKQFEGDYELGATVISVRLRGDSVLTTQTTGGRATELVGLRGKKFGVKDRPGFSIEFIPDASGKITQAAFYQPGVNAVAKKK